MTLRGMHARVRRLEKRRRTSKPEGLLGFILLSYGDGHEKIPGYSREAVERAIAAREYVDSLGDEAQNIPVGQFGWWAMMLGRAGHAPLT